MHGSVLIPSVSLNAFPHTLLTVAVSGPATIHRLNAASFSLIPITPPSPFTIALSAVHELVHVLVLRTCVWFSV